MTRYSIKLLLALVTFICATTTYANEGIKNGIYLGAGGGESFNNYVFSTTNTVTNTIANTKPSNNTFLGNIFAGYGLTTDENLYFGGELGTNFPQREASTTHPGVTLTGQTFTNHVFVQDYLTGDLLPGYRMDSKLLLYARLGLSYAHLQLTQDANSAAGTPSFSSNANKIGGRVGVGASYPLTKNLGVGADYFYAAYPAFSTNWPAYNIHFEQKPHTNYFGASLIYTF